MSPEAGMASAGGAAGSALFTDLYELTMAQGYWKLGLSSPAVFDMFFRRNPFSGGYAVFAGLEPLARALEAFRFSGEDLAWLEDDGRFEPGFVRFLADFRFRGDLYSVAEGEVVFPQEPILRVHADLIEAQLVEGLILNTLNFQSLIATKAARLARAAGKAQLMEFGLRRAQGQNGALAASRAAFIGGASSTSNALASRLYGIPASGTMAHSWVMTFPDELSAFRAYAEQYPDGSVFLIDTYDTLDSGIGNAIEAGRPLAAQGKRFGVRLDSGDMDYLSRRVREELDKAGLHDTFIVASNELDEEIVEALTSSGAPIDVWGVGTRLVTGGSDSSFTGVYKLSQIERRAGEILERMPVMKFSENPEKSTNPGVKDAWRLYGEDGMAVADAIGLSGDELASGQRRVFYHPYLDTRRFELALGKDPRPLMAAVMRGGRVTGALPDLKAARERRERSLSELDPSYLRLLNPHRYRVALTEGLRELKLGFAEDPRRARSGA